MKEMLPDVNERIAARVRELRSNQQLSLDALASRSGVSRSMISVVERGESSPTAVVLEKLAAGLGVTLGSLFDSPSPGKPKPISRSKEQLEWKDPASGYIRRNVSPPGIPQPMQIVDVYFPAGATLTFESARDGRIYQQIWILKGTMQITVGKERHELREGDCLAMQIERVVLFHNPSAKTARYAVVTSVDAPLRR